MFDEDDLLPVSALQHLLFCERQCALIHMDGIWLDNALTVEGTHLHRRADEGLVESRRDLVIARALPIRSLRLGLSGRADVVEFVRCPQGEAGATLPGRSGRWRPVPVEYKRGKPKAHRADEVQLCAQALCMEEMLGVEIISGALYYGARRRRQAVIFDAATRILTESAAANLRALLTGGILPTADHGPKCDACSLLPACMPRSRGGVQAYLRRELAGGSAT